MAAHFPQEWKVTAAPRASSAEALSPRTYEMPAPPNAAPQPSPGIPRHSRLRHPGPRRWHRPRPPSRGRPSRELSRRAGKSAGKGGIADLLPSPVRPSAPPRAGVLGRPGPAGSRDGEQLLPGRSGWERLGSAWWDTAPAAPLTTHVAARRAGKAPRCQGAITSPGQGGWHDGG